MKFATAKEHRDFFNKNRTIEFEGLIPDQIAKNMALELEKVLAKRLKSREGALSNISTERLYANGRNLWVDSEVLKKGEMQHQFGQLAYELFEHKPIRFGYDQYLPFYGHSSANEEKVYQDFLNQKHTLAEISAIQGVLGGLMLALPKRGVLLQQEQSNNLPSSIFPKEAGSGVFFAPDIPLDFSALLQESTVHYILIVYTAASSVYILNRKDPLFHYLKNMDYNFGDRLNDRFNPLIYK